MTETTMYWITRLDGIISLLSGLDILCSAVFVVSGMLWTVAASIRKVNEQYNRDGYADSDWTSADSLAKGCKPFAIWGLALSIAFSVAQMLIPTTREMVAIKVVPAIASPEMCEKTNDVGKDLVDVAAKWLKDVNGGDDKERKLK